jgi:hypothetical protein
MERRIHRPVTNRKRSTLDLPPSDLIGLSLEVQPLLYRRLTQQWLDSDGPVHLVCEPEGLFPDEGDSLRDINRLHEAYDAALWFRNNATVLTT